jgi:uncharacterized repeat protein (TIGR01451 family)
MTLATRCRNQNSRSTQPAGGLCRGVHNAVAAVSCARISRSATAITRMHGFARTGLLTVAAIAAVLSCEPVLAIGTLAGTAIHNTSSVQYIISGAGSSATSNTVTFRVDEKLDVNVAWQDAASISVSTPDTARVTTYLLTNTGNGHDSYRLSVDDHLAGDQFDPVAVDIYLDGNANGILDPGIDPQYVAGVNDPVLGPDASQLVFVRSTIPASLNNGDHGNTALVATSSTGSGVPGTAIASAGDDNTSAVIGASGGSGRATGNYVVNATTVTLVKSVVITDPQGGSQPVTGARLDYRINATVTGAGVASDVVITDPLPANTTYTSGSLSMNNLALTDSADGDAGDVGAASANTVTVHLGDLSGVSPVQTISFEVVIN